MAILLHRAANLYLADLEAKGKSPATIRNHRQALDHGIDCWGNVDCRDIREEQITRYFQNRSWSAGTQAIYLGALRSFGGFLRRRGVWPRDFDPTEDWHIRAEARRERLWLTVPQMLEMRDAEPNPRNKALFSLGMYTLGRSSEIISLKIGDLDLDRHTLVFYRHKTRQWDRLPVCQELGEHMESWLSHYLQVMARPLDPSWLIVPALYPVNRLPNPDGKGFYLTGTPRRIKPTQQMSKASTITSDALKRIGFREPGNGMHVLRRSSAREMFQQLRSDGYDHALRRVASMLGHKHTSETEHYIGVDAERRARDEMLAGKRMFKLAA